MQREVVMLAEEFGTSGRRPPMQCTRVANLLETGVLVIGDGYRAKNSEMSTARDGLPFARAGNINQGFLFEEADWLCPKSALFAGDKVSRPGDVVFTSKGTVGRFAYVTGGTPAFVYSPQLCYWRVLNTDRMDARFLYYWMHSREAAQQFDGLKGQTDMADYVSLRDQRNMVLTLPPIAQQRAIAAILGAFDDKIELNRHMNRTLEAMAQALFQSWFVDFDPVRAKMVGRQPAGMDAETAALFPDAVESTPGGTVPRGWVVRPIGELVKVVGGSTPSTTQPAYWDAGTVHWATPKDLAALTSHAILDTERCITARGLTQIASGLLPSGTVLLSSRAPIGYLAIAEVPLAINQGFIAMVCDQQLPNHYLLQWLLTNMDAVKARANGTTFQEVNKSAFRPILVTVPPRPLVQRFGWVAHALHQQVVNNLRQTCTLAAIRDRLLPRLLSGDLRVPDTGKLFGAAI